MGMQCNFNRIDLPDGIEIDYTRHIYSDTWSATIYFPEGPMIVSIANNPTGRSNMQYWFDVGQDSKDQLLKLQVLIRNRVCFNCS